VAVDIGDRALATGGRGEAGIVGKLVSVAVEFANIDDIGADGAFEQRIGKIAASVVSLTVFAVILSAPAFDRRSGRGFHLCQAGQARRRYPARSPCPSAPLSAAGRVCLA